MLLVWKHERSVKTQIDFQIVPLHQRPSSKAWIFFLVPNKKKNVPFLKWTWGLFFDWKHCRWGKQQEEEENVGCFVEILPENKMISDSIRRTVSRPAVCTWPRITSNKEIIQERRQRNHPFFLRIHVGSPLCEAKDPKRSFWCVSGVCVTRAYRIRSEPCLVYEITIPLWLKRHQQRQCLDKELQEFVIAQRSPNYVWCRKSEKFLTKCPLSPISITISQARCKSLSCFSRSDLAPQKKSFHKFFTRKKRKKWKTGNRTHDVWPTIFTFLSLLSIAYFILLSSMTKSYKLYRPIWNWPPGWLKQEHLITCALVHTEYPIRWSSYQD